MKKLGESISTISVTLISLTKDSAPLFVILNVNPGGGWKLTGPKKYISWIALISIADVRKLLPVNIFNEYTSVIAPI